MLVIDFKVCKESICPNRTQVNDFLDSFYFEGYAITPTVDWSVFGRQPTKLTNNLIYGA